MTKLIDLTGSFPEKSKTAADKLYHLFNMNLEISNNTKNRLVEECMKIYGGQYEEKKKKPIEFVLVINDGGATNRATLKPREMKEIRLVCKGYGNNEYDVMLCIGGSGTQLLYLGYANDFIIE